MKKIIFSVIFIVLSVCLHAQSLAWNIKFYKGKNSETVPISRIIRMETGEQFRISIKPDNDCFCYVICYDSDRNIYVLKNLLLTGGNEITTDAIDITDPSGTEMVYVIMSLKRQTQLENLIKTHSGNPNSQQATNNLYNEVIKLQNETSQLGEPANSFIASGGTTRSTSDEFATRFTDKALYVRAITIRH